MKIHLFWLPLIGALLAFKAFPSIRYEDKGISKTLEIDNEVLVHQIQETLLRLNIGSIEGGRYNAEEYDEVYEYSLVFDEIGSILESAQTMEELRHCSDTMQVIAQSICSKKDTDDRFKDLWFNTEHLTEEAAKGLGVRQAKILLKNNILIQELRVLNAYLNRMRCYSCFSKSYSTLLQEIAFRNTPILIECGTHWSRKYSE